MRSFKRYTPFLIFAHKRLCAVLFIGGTKSRWDVILFGITNSMLWSSGNGEYYCTTLISYRQSEDGQTVERGENAIVVINVKTGSYKVAEME